MTSEKLTLATALDYFKHWTSGSFDSAEDLLSDSISIVVPINSYDTKKEFIEAVRYTKSLTTDIKLISTFANSDEAMVVYDIVIPQFGTIKIAEHFVVRESKIVKLTQIHDTAPFRN